jgi:hypothetical protein
VTVTVSGASHGTWPRAISVVGNGVGEAVICHLWLCVWMDGCSGSSRIGGGAFLARLTDAWEEGSAVGRILCAASPRVARQFISPSTQRPGNCRGSKNIWQIISFVQPSIHCPPKRRVKQESGVSAARGVVCPRRPSPTRVVFSTSREAWSVMGPLWVNGRSDASPTCSTWQGRRRVVTAVVTAVATVLALDKGTGGRTNGKEREMKPVPSSDGVSTKASLTVHCPPGSVGLGPDRQGLEVQPRCSAAGRFQSWVGRRERHLGVAVLQCMRMVQENLAAQQQEQFPPVLGAPTRFASKKERSGAATGMLSVPGTRQGGLEAGSTWSAKLSLSFTSRTFCKVLSSVSFNLQLVQDPIEDSGLQRADQSHHGWVLRFGSARQPI